METELTKQIAAEIRHIQQLPAAEITRIKCVLRGDKVCVLDVHNPTQRFLSEHELHQIFMRSSKYRGLMAHEKKACIFYQKPFGEIKTKKFKKAQKELIFKK